MSLQLSDAKELVIQFARNQIEATKQENTRRGITKKNEKEAIYLIQKILSELCDQIISKQEAEICNNDI